MPQSQLAKRVLFAAVAVPISLFVVYLGGAALAGLLSIAAAISAWEFFRIVRVDRVEPFSHVGIVMAAALPLVVHARYLGVARPTITWVALLALLLFGLAIVRRGPSRAPTAAVGITLLGILYTGGLLAYAYALRHHRYAVGDLAGATLLAFPLVLTWTSDTGAFAVGSALGRHKLIPRISPGKTIEGAIGALVLCVIASLAYAKLALVPWAHLALPAWGAVTFGLLASVAVQTGDLAESLLKREGGVKDSSQLIPGHGGVLDRLDGMLFVLPVAYWYFGLGILRPVT